MVRFAGHRGPRIQHTFHKASSSLPRRCTGSIRALSASWWWNSGLAVGAVLRLLGGLVNSREEFLRGPA